MVSERPRPQADLASAAGSPARQHSTQGRGLLWVVVAFLLCPCHLPLTLALLATLLAGTAAGALLTRQPAAAGMLITLVWLLGTWHGFRLLRRK